MPVDSVPGPADHDEVIASTTCSHLDDAIAAFRAADTLDLGAELHLLTEYPEDQREAGMGTAVYRVILHRWAPPADGLPDPEG